MSVFSIKYFKIMLQTLSILPIICFNFLREKPKLAFQEKTQRAIFCKDSKEFFKMEARKISFQSWQSISWTVQIKDSRWEEVVGGEKKTEEYKINKQKKGNRDIWWSKWYWLYILRKAIRGNLKCIHYNIQERLYSFK